MTIFIIMTKMAMKQYVILLFDFKIFVYAHLINISSFRRLDYIAILMWIHYYYYKALIDIFCRVKCLSISTQHFNVLRGFQPLWLKNSSVEIDVSTFFYSTEFWVSANNTHVKFHKTTISQLEILHRNRIKKLLY